MRIEILCTGDEILSGKTVNTNHSHMARRLGEVGLTVCWGTSVGDDRESLREAFRRAAARADAVIVNGGLGPTVDDLSQEMAAEAAGVELVLHADWLARMEAFYERRGRVMPPNNRKQALLPSTAEFIDNPIGTACGFALEIDGTPFIFTPGVPREMRRMMEEQVIPRLLSRSGHRVATRMKRFHSFGIGESRADHMLGGVESLAPAGTVKLGFQAHYPQLETKLSVRADSEAELERLLAPVEAEVRSRLGTHVVAEDDDTLEGVVSALLARDGCTLATAEMLTSGTIAARFLPGKDAVDPHRAGVVSRDLGQLAAAAGLAAVPGSPDSSAASAIACALRRQVGTTHALATLVAVDEGEDRIELGGTVVIGISDAGGTVTREARLLGGREWVRLGAVELAIDCLRRRLAGLPVDERIDFEKR